MEEVISQLVAAEVGPDKRPVLVDFRFYKDDPVAVSLVFREAGERGDNVVWRLSRALLSEGLKTDTGEGDIQLWPIGDFKARLGMFLSSPDGTGAYVAMESRPVKIFLAESETLVHPDEEEAIVMAGIDDWLLEMEEW